MSTPETQLPLHGLPIRSAPALDLLTGIKVLDLTTSVAGPYAGQLLADMGATVVKVEKPKGGDDARAWGPPFLHGESLWFMSVNRGKKSVALDIAATQGQEVLRKLIAECDVILLNLVARAQRKLGLDAASLRKINPRLIHASISGFGLQGSRADLPCYDLIAEGYSSVMDLTGEPENGPQKVGTPAADLLAGGDAAMAILAALLRREREGKGCDIDISMVESMSRFMTPKLTPYLGSGEMARRAGGRDSVIAIYQVFETADDPMTLGLGNDAIWKRFWVAVGQSEVGADPKYASNMDRRVFRDEIVKVIAGLLRSKPRAYWLELLAQARVPAGPIQRIDEVARDPALHESGFIYRVAGPDGDVPQVGLGIRFDGQTEGSGTSPKLGANTEEILRNWIRCEDAEIAELRTQQII
ncbi:CoA transferase [Ottowia caeni]|uniref:CaiB/BaiF CoA transferase family protein n=1 Tax=Ottowia caeni TaxID=2870339 RepID=UPI001E4280E7|nr:CoA transferase [Ottowia caeni]